MIKKYIYACEDVFIDDPGTGEPLMVRKTDDGPLEHHKLTWKEMIRMLFNHDPVDPRTGTRTGEPTMRSHFDLFDLIELRASLLAATPTEPAVISDKECTTIVNLLKSPKMFGVATIYSPGFKAFPKAFSDAPDKPREEAKEAKAVEAPASASA